MSWDAWVLAILIGGCAAVVLICIVEDLREQRFSRSENRTVRIHIRDGECITAHVRREPAGRHRDQHTRP